MVDLLAEVVEALVEFVELGFLPFNVRAVLLELAGQGVGARLCPQQVLLRFIEQELLGLELIAHGLQKKQERGGFCGCTRARLLSLLPISCSSCTRAAEDAEKQLSCRSAMRCGEKQVRGLYHKQSHLINLMGRKIQILLPSPPINL